MALGRNLRRLLLERQFAPLGLSPLAQILLDRVQLADPRQGMSLGIAEEIITRQPPEAQAIIRALLAEIAELKTRIEALERQIKAKTPQNSSLPPSTQHP